MKTLKTKIKIGFGILLLAFCLLAPSAALAETTCQTSGSPNVKKNLQAKPEELQQCLKNNKITQDLNKIVNFLSAGVAIIVTGVVILGGIQYMLAGDNAAAITAARQRITNGLIALAVFLLTYAFLQWIIPGGAFG